ncbi:MAG: hypothetical protein HYV28_04240 [Ignavibacteriales bacterium]|nr:hypothetical protein [Ignavibacteriales bacterium]
MNKMVLEYLDNQMTGEQRLIFEKELAASPELQKELEQAKSFFVSIEQYNTRPALEDYFSEARVRFKTSLSERLQKAWYKRPIPVFSLSGSMVVVALIGILILKSPANSVMEAELKEVAPEIALAYVQGTPVESEMMQNSIEDVVELNDILDDALTAEIGVSQENAGAFLDNLQLTSDELLSSLSEEEVNELSKKLEN